MDIGDNDRMNRKFGRDRTQGHCGDLDSRNVSFWYHHRSSNSLFLVSVLVSFHSRFTSLVVGSIMPQKETN